MEVVGASPDPHGPLLLDLVAHGIGEGLGGCGTCDRVAVVVQGGVELAQLERPVAGDQLQGRAAQARPPELDRVVVRWGQGRFLHAGRTAARPMGRAGPDLFSELVEAVQRKEALHADLVELLVHLCQLGGGCGPCIVEALLSARDAEPLP